MHSVFGIGSKKIKQGYNIFKNRTFYISFDLINTFPGRSEYSKEKRFLKNSILPTFFQAEPNIFFICHNRSNNKQ